MTLSPQHQSTFQLIGRMATARRRMFCPAITFGELIRTRGGRFRLPGEADAPRPAPLDGSTISVSSTITTASAPEGSGAPVMIRVAVPLVTC